MLERTEKTKSALCLDVGIALLPAAAWSAYLFGARAIVLMLLCGLFAFGFDIPCSLYIFKMPLKKCLSGFAFLSGVLAAFLLPVTAPLWFAPIVGALVALCRSMRFWFCHRPLNAAVTAAAALCILFPSYMERYTKPFAYFPAFQINIDPALVAEYQCWSPLDLIMKGKLYEDGIYGQLYGLAAGPLGAVGVLCIVFGFGYLIARRIVRIETAGMYLLTLVVMACALSPNTTQMLTYAWFYILSGAVPFAAFFALNDYATSPMRQYGTALILFGVLAALLTVLFRALRLGLLGDLLAILLADLATPFLEKFTEPRAYYDKKKKS